MVKGVEQKQIFIIEWMIIREIQRTGRYLDPLMSLVDITDRQSLGTANEWPLGVDRAKAFR